MGDRATYSRLLSEAFGADVWTDRVLPAMKDIVVTSLKCVQEPFAEPATSACSFQLFGYDFMVDSELKVWLIEVNKTPMMHGSGPVTGQLCDACLHDLLDVVYDAEGADRETNEGAGRLLGQPGRFELLHRGPKVPKAR